MNAILPHRITVLSDNFTTAAASRSNYLLRAHPVLIPRTNLSPRITFGAIDFRQGWKENYVSVSQSGRLCDSLHYRVISTNRIEYQGGGGSTSVEHHHVRRGSKYMVAPDRKKGKKK